MFNAKIQALASHGNRPWNAICSRLSPVHRFNFVPRKVPFLHNLFQKQLGNGSMKTRTTISHVQLMLNRNLLWTVYSPPGAFYSQRTLMVIAESAFHCSMPQLFSIPVISIINSTFHPMNLLSIKSGLYVYHRLPLCPNNLISTRT